MSPASAPPPEPATVARLRACADTVRIVAEHIERSVHDLQAFDRPDVWQGGRAADFREGLEDQTRLLLAPDHGTVAQLHEAARRIVLRADALQGDMDHAARDHLVVVPPS